MKIYNKIFFILSILNTKEIYNNIQSIQTEDNSIQYENRSSLYENILNKPIIIKNNVKYNYTNGINIKATLRKKDHEDINLVIPYNGYIFINKPDILYKIEFDIYGQYKSIIYNISNNANLKLKDILTDYILKLDENNINSILNKDKYIKINLYNSFFMQSNNHYINNGKSNDIYCDIKITLEDKDNLFKLNNNTILKFRIKDKKRKEELKKKYNINQINNNQLDIYSLKETFSFYEEFFSIIFPGLKNRGNMDSYYSLINFIASKITFNLLFKDLSQEDIARYLLNLEDKYSNLDLQYSYESILEYWDLVKKETDNEDYESHEAIDLIIKTINYSYNILKKN